MRKKVEHYKGNEITKEILKRIHLIDTKRIQEGTTQFNMEECRTLKELCEIYETTPKKTHIILGADWYIVYAYLSEEEIDIKDWVAIDGVENKFTQTMEMFSALKNILLTHKDYDIYSMLRHSTSYPFYQKMVNEGLVEEGYDMVDLDESSEELEAIKEQILDKYDSIEDYLSDETRERYEDMHLDDNIYHNVVFNTTEKFNNRYKR